jgi:hypothetical protein
LDKRWNWQFTYDDKGFPIKGEPEWVSPSMISVSDKLQGNQTQDLLYQLGIEEAKEEWKVFIVGRHCFTPEKQKKLMNDLIEKYLGKSCTCNGWTRSN